MPITHVRAAFQHIRFCANPCDPKEIEGEVLSIAFTPWCAVGVCIACGLPVQRRRKAGTYRGMVCINKKNTENGLIRAA